jgi:hypothetical protein
MSHDQIGPKQRQLMELKAAKVARISTDELRAKVAAVPPVSAKRAAKKAAKKAKRNG